MNTLARIPDQYEAIRVRAASVALSLKDLAIEADESGTVNGAVMDILRRSGLIGYTVPAEFGGVYESVDPFAVCLIREELMKVSSHADSLFALQGIGSYAVAIAGSDEVKNEWLPRVATGEILAGLALTEPDAGSDLKRITTTARKEGDCFIIDGHKSFISNAGAAAYYTVLAKEEGEGLSAFFVPAHLRGISTRSAPELIAPHVLGDVLLDSVVIPSSFRIGESGQGLNPILSTLAIFRISVAGAAIGLAQTALDEATRHARNREQFGRPLIRLGPVAGLLADSWADIASTRLLAYEVAKLAREDPLGHIEHSSLAKLAATEACSRVVDRCVQVMGRWGLIHNSRIERCYRQARAMRIYEGASEVIRLGIAKELGTEVT